MQIANSERVTFKIVLVGTGGTGSQLIPFLMQMANNFIDDINEIILIDGDKIESKNLKNQKFTIYDVSEYKSKVLCERYMKVYPQLNIKYIDRYALTEEQLLNTLATKNLSTIPILIGCVDNNASRKLFNKVFYNKDLLNLIYIDSGNGTQNRNGQVVVGYKTTIKTKEQKTENTNVYSTYKKTYEILKPVCKVFKNILKDNDSLDKLTSCTQTVDKHPQNIATNIMAATTIFTILNELISFKVINTHIAYFDAQDTSILNRSVKKIDYTEFLKDKNLLAVI